MNDVTRTQAAHLLRGYRRISHDYARKAARQTGILAEIDAKMAERYRTLALGAREMLYTLYPQGR